MSDKEFIEEIYELAFGDDAIKKGYTKEEVIQRVKEYSDLALKAEKRKQRS